MPSETVRRVSVWNVAFWVWITATTVINTISMVRDPTAPAFFAFWLTVAAVAGSVGTVVALLIVAIRKITASRSAATSLRIF